MSGGAPLYRPAAVRPSTSISGISGISASASAASLAPSTHLAFPSTDSDLAAALRRVDLLSSEGIDEGDTQTGDESLDTEDDEDDDDDDILSTTSGRRHGALLQPEMDDWLILETPYMIHWNHKRHSTGGNPRQRNPADAPDWRMRERLRTVTAALVMCLNIGVDPPDVSKTNPCSKLLCWMDPSSLEVSKALPAIGKNLQAQFETLSMKTRYKQYLDPIVEETKRFCTSLRRTAKDERVLFYYNGFGVPKPTPGGEIWVFNKAYTQYIPVTLFDLQNWLGSPCIFVWDASSAGNVVVNFKRLAERRAEEERASAGGSSQPPPTQPGASAQHFPLRESIHLAACAPDEVLPMNPDLPADLFTCCLTSPIEISLRWFVLQNPLPSRLNVDMVMNIPGRLQDRRTPLGELNWIFTAITDTIAWTVLPRAIFRRLFRDDLMVAALLRNFLLAERIMRFYHCTPMSHPKLPPTHNHPLWDSWDLAVDQCLAQLPTLLEKEKAQADAANGGPPVPPHLAAFEYRHSSFFSEQLKAFEVWLSQGGVSRKGRRRRVDATSLAIRHGVTGIPHAGSSASSAAGTVDEEDEATARPQRDPPDQLPIVLQVLLSQVHRLRALILLSKFLDLGPWAVNLALSIGIFPYVLKLLQSPAADLKPVLIYIWARILAVDRSCQNDLLRDSGFVYFAGVLSPFSPSTSANAAAPGASGNGIAPLIPNVSEHRAMCAFILAIFCQDFPAGQAAALETDAMDSCLEHLEDDDYLLRQWSALCLAQLWDESAAGKARGLSKDAQGKLCMMLADASPEVRAAVLYALGTLLGASGSSFDPLDPLTTSPSAKHTGGQRPRCLGTGTATGLAPADQRSLEVNIAVTMLVTRGDCSPMVRKELVVALSPLIREYQGFFVVAAYLYYEREDRRQFRRARTRSTSSRTTQTFDAQEEQDEDEAVIKRIIERLPAEYKLSEADEANIAACSTIFTALLDLSADAYPEVASLTCTILDYIVALMRESGVGRIAENTTLRFGAGAGDATHRLVTPKATNLGAEGYFSYTPRRASQDIAGHAFAFGSSSTAANSLNSNGYSSLRSPGRPAARRAPSLAQTVKAIATLGYSRPSSPTGSPDEDQSGMRSPASAAGSAQHSVSVTPALAARVPAPSFNLAQYVSPYAQARRSTTPTTPETPRSPSATLPTSSSTAALVAAAHRSSSAESLAAIARLQARRGNTSGSTTPGGTISSPLAERHPTPSSAALAPPQVTPPEKDDVKAVAALANLVAADLQRFKDRAALGAELAAAGVPPGAAGLVASSAGNTPLASPSMTRTSTREGNHSSASSAASSPGGNSAGLREVLPLKSRLFSWCAAYYTEPQMKSAEAEEPGSVKYNVQTWKQQRNERLVSESQAQTDHAGSTPWTDNIGTIKNGAPPYLMLMHQFESHLVTASEQDTISVWDWERQKLLSRFRNGNPEKTNVTSAAFVNEDVDALLLIGSAEGDVRLYSNYDESPTHVPGSGPKLVSTFRALPDLARTKRPAGLIVDWQQLPGHLLAAGDSSVVRVWDANRELCVCDIPTRTTSSVTSLTSEYDVGHIFVAGFSDGTVGVYDRRNPPEASLVRLWEEHTTWVQNVHLQRRGNRELLSASVDGEVRLWDLRGRSSISRANISGALGGKLSCVAVHERAQVFAAASHPRATRSGGIAPHQIILSHLDSLAPNMRSSPLARNFGAGSSSLPGVGGPSSISSGIARAPSAFTPAFGALAFHPHNHVLAYASPDAAGTIGVVRCPPPKPGSAPQQDDDERKIPEYVDVSGALPTSGPPEGRPRSLFGF